MKILTLTGTRPELIRLSVILKKLSLPNPDVKHVHVYTNQNYDPNLSEIFLTQLGITVDYIFNKTNGVGEFLSNGFNEFNTILDNEKPDKVLVLGDTNSALLCVLAAKKGIPVYHMEAGNRCYDTAVPEETNRMVVDACSYINLPYTSNSKENLVREGHHKNRVFKIGNPINEVLFYYSQQINSSKILIDLGLCLKNYVLFTFHRTENVDSRMVSSQVIDAINNIAQSIPVVFPLHPRTRDQFNKHGITLSKNIIVTEPLGLFDFVKLEQNARVVITDSGTVPEETTLFGVPCVVLRNTTERQELMETGSFILAGYKTKDIIRAFNEAYNYPKTNWRVSDEYLTENVSDVVIKILMGLTPVIVRRGHDDY